MFDSEATVLSHISSFPLFQYNVIEIMVRITETLTPIILCPRNSASRFQIFDNFPLAGFRTLTRTGLDSG